MTKQIAQQLRALANDLDGTTDTGPGLIYPGPNGLVIIGGWVFAIDEPIAGDWKPSFELVERAARYGRIGVDPSNAFDSGLPKRSPSGYPMVYPVGMFGPAAPGRIAYGSQTFKDEAELADHKRRAP